MIMNKKLFFPAVVLLFLSQSIYGQVQSISFYTDYSTALSKRLSVNKADGVGGGLTLRFKVADMFVVSLTGGYTLYSVSQDSALQKWNWDFWEIRYKNRVAADLAENPGSKASLVPVQKMDLLPVLIGIGKEFNLSESFAVYAEAGGGLYFYTRRMYLAEEWQRRFDSYGLTYEYAYRNFATDKYGNPAVVFGNVTGRYTLSEGFALEAKVKYSHILNINDKMGYNAFIFENDFGFAVSAVFNY